MKWQLVDEKYLEYLRKFEPRIPNSHYGKEKIKPFFGTLFEIGELIYLSQVSSPKTKHEKMKNNADFVKIIDSKNSRLLSVINLNYMFPAPKSETMPLDYDKMSTYREFQNEQAMVKYIILLKKEISVIKGLSLEQKAEKLYRLRYEYPDSFISKRCLDFKRLEEYAVSWKLR
jgi:protein AbiQ